MTPITLNEQALRSLAEECADMTLRGIRASQRPDIVAEIRRMSPDQVKRLEMFVEGAIDGSRVPACPVAKDAAPRFRCAPEIIAAADERWDARDANETRERRGGEVLFGLVVLALAAAGAGLWWWIR